MRFLFDNHVHYAACWELRRRGIDVEHVADVGLRRARDETIMLYAAQRGQIVVTRDYRDFARLLEVFAAREIPTPGVLFVSRSIPPNDAGAHVRALEKWIEVASERADRPMAGILRLADLTDRRT